MTEEFIKKYYEFAPVINKIKVENNIKSNMVVPLFMISVSAIEAILDEHFVRIKDAIKIVEKESFVIKLKENVKKEILGEWIEKQKIIDAIKKIRIESAKQSPSAVGYWLYRVLKELNLQ